MIMMLNHKAPRTTANDNYQINAWHVAVLLNELPAAMMRFKV